MLAWPMKLSFGLPFLLCALLLAWLAASTVNVNAHTLPISYLKLVPEADYLHLELVFNPFELSFMPELDDNKDAEVDPGELTKHGQMLADRMAAALKLTAGNTVLKPETAGMDPDLNGHHVRARAHYKVDARRLPLTVESDLVALTSSSHLTQVTYINGGQQQLAQLDPHSRRVTFQPAARSQPPATIPTRHRAASGLALLAVTALFVVISAMLVWVLRKQSIR